MHQLTVRSTEITPKCDYRPLNRVVRETRKIEIHVNRSNAYGQNSDIQSLEDV